MDTDQNEVAAALNLSVRTLRRRLEADGTSYRELVAETRQVLAEKLLGIGATVEDVAHRLGYADAAGSPTPSPAGPEPPPAATPVPSIRASNGTVDGA
ncbi:helix-turn-helix domain-containing protein [Nocardia gipuzkoensis]|jgi:hypothetical protein